MKTKTIFYKIKHEAYYDGYHTKKFVLLREGELLEPRQNYALTASGRRVDIDPQDYDEIALDDDLVIRHDPSWDVGRAFES